MSDLFHWILKRQKFLQWPSLCISVFGLAIGSTPTEKHICVTGILLANTIKRQE